MNIWHCYLAVWPGGHIKWTKEAQSLGLYQAVLDLLLPGITSYGLVTTISQVRNGTALKQCYKITPVTLNYS